MKILLIASIIEVLVIVCASAPAGALPVRKSVSYPESVQAHPSTQAALPCHTVWRYNVTLLGLSDVDRQEQEAGGVEYTGAGSEWNWHRVFGYSTIVTGLAAILTGFIAPDAVHWGFAVASTALGVATCANGFYSYRGVIGGSAQYTAHAVMGTAATAGFITTLFLAGREGSRAHAVSGAASGLVFTVSVGICYF
ncbi:MAG: hypothetical protein JXA20_17580 [Spirochaetes bacterium]|nr:hypothetical protein [Spirochaetota bacterium]